MTEIDARVASILAQASEGGEISKPQAIELLKIDPNSSEFYALMAIADSLSRRQFNNRGEVFAQIGINFWPCSKNCAFCSFGESTGLVKSPLEFSLEEVVTRAKAFEEAGANAIFLMTTADYPFDQFIEIAKAVREDISLPLVANIGDFGTQEAEALLSAGFQGVYHVFRLRESKDTRIPSEVRLATLDTIKDSKLELGFCVEPIGPEHSPEELVEEMFRGKQYGTVNHAAMWRVPAPGIPLAPLGKISEVELAKAVAVTRLVSGDIIKAMGVHEPRVLALRAGANQIYAETGPNPRDTLEDTSKGGRGFSVEKCKEMLWEAGWMPLEGPTQVFGET
ncbi:MAG: radical SAM protein [Dehalococcoidia bacterium]|nr:MAG: radical SAM protein [Dehalococcoidia bacterium]